MIRIVIAVVLGVTLAGAASCWAGSNEGAGMALDIRSHLNLRTCTPSYTSCEEIDSSYPGTGTIDVLVVVYEYSDFLAAEYSVEWPSTWNLVGFVSCSDLEITGAVGGSTLNVSQAWETPQTAATGTSGVALGWLHFTNTSEGQLTLQAHTVSGFRGLVDSLIVKDDLAGEFTGQVGQATGGDDPCPSE